MKIEDLMDAFKKFQAIHKDCPFMRLEIYSFGAVGIIYGGSENKSYISPSHFSLEELYQLMIDDINGYFRSK